MKSIRLKDVDLLDEAFRNISMYAYLLALVEYDKQENIVRCETVNTVQQSVEFLLSEEILKQADKMSRIINRNDFLL